jgi:tetratricopeptide (TPR) repeat protein
MYFNRRERQQLVPSMDDEEIDRRLRKTADRLAELPETYRSFGPYWWIVKGALRSRKGRRAWFTGPADDPELRDDSDGRESRGLLEEGFFYFDQDSRDGMPVPDLHLVEGRAGAFVYQLQDPDAGRQLDLFEEVENQERLREQFLRNTASYLPGPWLQAGDEAVTEGEHHRAVARYKRALTVAHDEESRLQSWLRIGTALDEAGHYEKAIVAFEQAYRRGKEGWILGLIGQAALAAGRYGEAANRFSAALETMPGNPEYQAGLEAARARLAEQDRELAIG